MVGERASPEVIENIRKQIGSDRNIITQYVGYIKLLLGGEFGRSYYTNRLVAEDLALKIPNTMKLAFGAMLIATPLGIVLGFIAAYRSGTRLDRIITTVSVLGISTPVFWLGLLLMLLVSFKLKLLPPSGTGSIRFLILPALTLALPAVATLARVTRTSKNALIPIITVVGLDFGSYLNGAFLTETIFGWDGIGRFAMEGIIKRDYPVVMGTIIVGTLMFVLVNLIVDIMYHYMDPRIRMHMRSKQ
jgi:ABC-type dipeptide/oligopeptide/nickel transport system permease component